MLQNKINTFLKIFSLIIIFPYFIACSNSSKNPNQLATSIPIDSLIAQYPDSISLRLQRGNKALEEYRFFDALADGAHIFRLDSNQIETRMLYAQALNNKSDRTIEDVANAQRHFQYVLQHDKQNIEALVALAGTYRYLQDSENAFKYVNDALRIDPKKKEAYALKGSLYLDLKNYKLAKSSYETAIQQDPTFYEAYLHLAVLYHQEANPIALEYYQTAHELQPKDPELLYSLAFAQETFGKWDEAKENYHLLSDNKDKFYKARAFFHLGHIKQRKENEIDSALYYYSQAIKMQKNYVEAYHNRGMCYELQGNIQSAKREYTQAIQLDKNFSLSSEALERLFGK